MIIIKEKQKLDEMAIRAVSTRKDGLPFRITVKSPDHQPSHAHVMDAATGKIELGQFKISSKPPARPEDIENYKQGITDEMRNLIFKWASLISKKPFYPGTNWGALNNEWSPNDPY
jgi:hypothetical protein